MALGRVVLGRIICKIFLSALPVDVELFLSMPVANPIKSHIHCFGSALYNSVSEDSDGTFVVELERRRALWMAHLLEGGTDWDSVFGVDESRSCFRFLDGGHDGVNNFAIHENRCIVRRRGVIGADWQLRRFCGEILVSPVAGACF